MEEEDQKKGIEGDEISNNENQIEGGRREKQEGREGKG